MTKKGMEELCEFILEIGDAFESMDIHIKSGSMIFGNQYACETYLEDKEDTDDLDEFFTVHAEGCTHFINLEDIERVTVYHHY